MEYKGYTIICTCYGQWKVILNYYTEWLADSEEDAKRMVDNIKGFIRR